MKKLQILLFGTGQMAYEYAKVFTAQGHDFIVIGRGENSAKIFQEKTGITPITGGAYKFLAQSDYSKFKAIIAVDGGQLGKVAIALMRHGVKSILLEKPGGLDAKEIKSVKEIADKYSAEVFIAYNRRFYTSVIKAQEIIKKDGGVLSFHFDFTELANQVASLNHPVEIKNQWLLHNSSHVIDLAFVLGGKPEYLAGHTSESLPWHPKGAIFTGHGLSETKAPFTYHANWLAPGRWNLEIMTKNHKLIFKPLEKLHVQTLGTFEIKEFPLEDRLDTQFKPGLYNEVLSFLGNQQNLCTISEQAENLKFYQQILNGV